jgi:hypothetical protein
MTAGEKEYTFQKDKIQQPQHMDLAIQILELGLDFICGHFDI